MEVTDMETQETIMKRKSVRRFGKGNISSRDIETIINAGIQAPSGKNGQPWKVIVLHDDKTLFPQIATQMIFSRFIAEADCLIAILLDKEQSYDHIKDMQAIGAFIENMLLMATDLGIGSCWIGEVTKRTDEISKLLNLTDNLELAALIALGEDADRSPKSSRKSLNDCIIEWR